MTYSEPLIVCFLAILFAGLFLCRKRPGVWLAWAGACGLFLISWPPADWLGTRLLEGGYPVEPFQTPAAVQAIVVLSEALEPARYERPYNLLGQNTYQRCSHGLWIYRQRPLPLLLCGGRVEGRNAPASAAVMREYLEGEGVPPSMIWTEEQSRNTYENALYGARILRRHGVSSVALVVDGQSMPRAAACFRKQGIAVTPAPSRLRQWSSPGQELMPGWSAIQRNEATLHEAAGLLWYWMRGWI